MKKRSPFLAIFLSLITFGIYYLVWIVKLTNDSNTMCPEKKTASGGKALLFMIITFGVYSLYWHYKLGEKTRGSGVLSLILCFIGVGYLINMCMAQKAINKYIDAHANDAAAPEAPAAE